MAVPKIIQVKLSKNKDTMAITARRSKQTPPRQPNNRRSSPASKMREKASAAAKRRMSQQQASAPVSQLPESDKRKRVQYDTSVHLKVLAKEVERERETS